MDENRFAEGSSRGHLHAGKYSPLAFRWVPQNSRDHSEPRKSLVRALDTLIFVGAVATIASRAKGARMSQDSLQLQALLPIRFGDLRRGCRGGHVQPGVEARVLPWSKERAGHEVWEGARRRLHEADLRTSRRH